MRKIFEKWLIAQWGGGMKMRLSFTETDGYDDETINAMWIGFNAGYELKP